MAETLKEKTAKGLFWGAMNSGSTQILNILFGIFLARLLTPADYGIIGILTILLSLQVICRAVALRKPLSISSNLPTMTTIPYSGLMCS